MLFDFDVFSKEHKKKIGRRIHALRILNNFTQETLSNEILSSPRVLSSWENGLDIPDGIYLFRLALILNSSADYILCLHDNSSAVAVYSKYIKK